MTATETATCQMCQQPATHRVNLYGRGSGRLLSSALVCDKHADNERSLRDLGLSMATVEIEEL